jgi:hypothetical protein
MFCSQYFSFPCQYHSTIARYSFIHLPPSLFNVITHFVHYFIHDLMTNNSICTTWVRNFIIKTVKSPTRFHLSRTMFSFIAHKSVSAKHEELRMANPVPAHCSNLAFLKAQLMVTRYYIAASSAHYTSVRCFLKPSPLFFFVLNLVYMRKKELFTNLSTSQHSTVQTLQFILKYEHFLLCNLIFQFINVRWFQQLLYRIYFINEYIFPFYHLYFTCLSERMHRPHEDLSWTEVSLECQASNVFCATINLCQYSGFEGIDMRTSI